MSELIGLIILVLLAVIQRYVFANKNIVWLGAILPVIFLATTITLLVKSEQSFNFSNILPITLGATIFLGLWIEGYDSHKKRLSMRFNLQKQRINKKIKREKNNDINI